MRGGVVQALGEAVAEEVLPGGLRRRVLETRPAGRARRRRPSARPGRRPRRTFPRSVPSVGSRVMSRTGASPWSEPTARISTRICARPSAGRGSGSKVLAMPIIIWELRGTTAGGTRPGRGTRRGRSPGFPGGVWSTRNRCRLLTNSAEPAGPRFVDPTLREMCPIPSRRRSRRQLSSENSISSIALACSATQQLEPPNAAKLREFLGAVHAPEPVRHPLLDGEAGIAVWGPARDRSRRVRSRGHGSGGKRSRWRSSTRRIFERDA